PQPADRARSVDHQAPLRRRSTGPAITWSGPVTCSTTSTFAGRCCCRHRLSAKLYSTPSTGCPGRPGRKGRTPSMTPPPSAVAHLLHSPSRAPTCRSPLAERFAAGTAMAAAVAEDGRRRARQEKEARERRQRQWDDAIGPLRDWVAGTDVLLAALLW